MSAIQGPEITFQNRDVWLVQVPVGFDASTAEVRSEDEIIDKNGTKYQLRPTEMPLGSCQILVGDAENMQPATTKPEGLMVLSQVVAVPRIDYAAVEKPKPRVRQRSDIRLRHYATGYGGNDEKLPRASGDASMDTKVKVDKKREKEKRKDKERSKHHKDKVHKQKHKH